MHSIDAPTFSCKAPCNVGATPGTDLATYMRQSPEFLTGLALPLGAQLTRQTEDGFTMALPKINLFDVWVQPTATATVTCVLFRVLGFRVLGLSV